MGNDELTTKQAAEILGCTARQVSWLVKRGRIRGRAITPRLYLVEAESVREYANREVREGWQRGRSRKEPPADEPAP